MEEVPITCPNCGHEFELSDALTGKIKQHLKAELLQDIKRREAKVKKELESLELEKDKIQKSRESIEQEVEKKLKDQVAEIEEKAKKKLEDKYSEQLSELKDIVKEKDESLKSFREQEIALRKRQREFEEAQESMDLEISRKVEEEKDKIREEASKKTSEKYTSQITDLQSTLEEHKKNIEEFRTQELELRKKQRELEESKRALELDVARKIDEEREKIKHDAAKTAAEGHRLKDLEKDKVINDLRSSLEEMKRKAEQGSMETQGEVLEQDFEEQLASFFLHDKIMPVPKGIRGADLIHCVRTPLGTDCGILLWEMKTPKHGALNGFQNSKMT